MMTDNERINEIRRTMTWIRKALKHLDSGRIDLARELLNGKLKELDTRRIDLSIHQKMYKRKQMKVVK